jgi:two-component system chemotaxis response regulator CheY
MKSSFPNVDSDLPILIVDDFSTMRRIIRTCLQQLGFTNVTEADDGLNAMTKLRSKEFKLIISDWNMPNMMGIDLLKAVRSDEKFKEIPFVMVTAEGLKENVMEAIKSGASNYVVKPFTADTLGQKLGVVFNKMQTK